MNDNLATTPADYTAFSITAPSDSRLPGGGNYVISNLYDVVPAKFGQIDNNLTSYDKFGDWYQHYDGFQLNVTARPQSGLALQGGLSTGKTVRDLCGIRAANPELNYVTPANASGPGNVYAQATFPYCHFNSGFVTGLASYTIPKADVLLSGTFRSDQGSPLAANLAVTSAVVAQTLGRSPSGNVPNVTVNLIEPGTLYGDRVNEIDFRVAKILKFGRTKATAGVDIYNALNSTPVLSENANFAAFRAPTAILPARFVKFGAQFDF